MSRFFLTLGAISAFVAVAAGAFGAHGLKGRLTAEMLEIFETAVRYQMYHAFGLLTVALAQARLSSSLLIIAGWAFVIGTILFSGSLYILGLTRTRWLGAITPLGGLAFLAGWLCLAYASLTARIDS